MRKHNLRAFVTFSLLCIGLGLQEAEAAYESNLAILNKTQHSKYQNVQPQCYVVLITQWELPSAMPCMVLLY